MSLSDRESFTEWLRESPLHVSEFLRVAHVHDSLERFKLWSQVEVGAIGEPDNVVQLRDDDERPLPSQRILRLRFAREFASGR